MVEAYEKTVSSAKTDIEAFYNKAVTSLCIDDDKEQHLIGRN